MAVTIAGRRIDMGNATDAETVDMFTECLNLLPEADALTIIKDWLRDNGLEGEL